MIFSCPCLRTCNYSSPPFLCFLFSVCLSYKDGQIDADELQKCLTQSGIAGGYKRK